MDGELTVIPLFHWLKRPLKLDKVQRNSTVNFYVNGTNVGGVISTDKVLSDEAAERLDAHMRKTYAGLKNSHGVMILEGGAKFEPIKINLADAQFLESRKFQVSEIARWFGVKPHMISDLSNATFSNIEQQSIESVRYTFRPRIVRWEYALNRLIPPHLQGKFYFKFNLEGLLRGETKSRYEAYRIAIQDGWMNADEVRAMEDLNPIGGDSGKLFMVPLNMQNRENLLTTQTDEHETTEAVKVTEAEEEAKEKELTEAQTKSLLSLRKKTADQYRTILKTKAEKLVKKEAEEIKKILAETTNAEDLKREIKNFYNNLKEEINKSFSPVFSSLADNLIDVVADELSKDKINTERLSDFVEKYVNGFAVRHTGSAEGQLKKIINEAPQSEREEQIEARLNEWEQKTPGKIVDREIVRAREGITKALYGYAGVRKIISVASGDSCPFCSQLNGKVIDIDGYFLSAGSTLKADGKELPINSNISHAPYHAGCNCHVMAYQ